MVFCISCVVSQCGHASRQGSTWGIAVCCAPFGTLSSIMDCSGGKLLGAQRLLPRGIMLWEGRHAGKFHSYATNHVIISIDWLIDWSVDRLIDRLIDWLIDWLICQLIGWLIDWLIDSILVAQFDYFVRGKNVADLFSLISEFVLKISGRFNGTFLENFLFSVTGQYWCGSTGEAVL